MSSYFLQQLQRRLQISAFTPPADAAVLLILTDESSPRLLFTKRASHLHKHAGEVSFPGGKREIDDVDDIAVALRESNEEVGLQIENIEILGELPVQQSKYGLSVKPIVGVLKQECEFVIQPDEIEKIFWVDLDYFVYEDAKPYQISYQQRQINVPSFQVQGEVIWGLTGRMIIDLLYYGLNISKKWPMVM